jgi:hypothetical protein
MNDFARWSDVLATSALLVMLAGCTVGPNVMKLAPAQTGQGIAIVVVPVETPDGPTYGRISAELLAVRDDALLLRAGLITLVSYASIAEVEVEGLQRLNFGDGQPPTEDHREELRLLSRYPQGGSDDILRRLLDAYDQDELHTIP